MEKESKKFIFSSTPIILLLLFPLLCVGVDFFWGNKIQFDRWIQYISSSEKAVNRTLEDEEFFNSHLARLVRGEDRRNLEETGFACDRSIHSIVCVSTKHVRINTTDMTVYIPSNHTTTNRETIVRPYAKQEDELKVITPVRMIQHRVLNTTSHHCDYTHRVPAVIFSSGSTGNVFHEMNEIVIPLYITTKQFQSRVQFLLEDFKPSFMAKYGKVLAHLSSYPVIDPALNRSTHCFPSVIVGLRYHDNLALNSSEIPGGYGMSSFRQFLRRAYGLKYSHASQIGRPRLMLLSRTNTRRFLNEEEMIALMREVGFQVVVIKRSKIASDLDRFSRMINSCGVLVGAHGAGLTNEIFLPDGGVMIQVELLGTEWASNTYYGDTARAMGVRYLRYKIGREESSLAKLYGINHTVVNDETYLFGHGGYRAARTVYLDQQNVRVDLERFRGVLVEALSIVTDFDR